jgi:hypothetical protein
MNETIDRLNALTVESTQTLLDGVYLAQKQNAELAQSWFKAFEANHQANRELVGRIVKQGQEIQNAWLAYTREAYQTFADRFVATAGTSLREASEQLDRAGRTANGAKTAAAK